MTGQKRTVSKQYIDFKTEIHDAENVLWNTFSYSHLSLLSAVICNALKTTFRASFISLAIHNFPEGATKPNPALVNI